MRKREMKRKKMLLVIYYGKKIKIFGSVMMG
jgi:hypothetical protein